MGHYFRTLERMSNGSLPSALVWDVFYIVKYKRCMVCFWDVTITIEWQWLAPGVRRNTATWLMDTEWILLKSTECDLVAFTAALTLGWSIHTEHSVTTIISAYKRTKERKTSLIVFTWNAWVVWFWMGTNLPSDGIMAPAENILVRTWI